MEHSRYNIVVAGTGYVGLSMAELFDCSPDNVSLHLKNIYGDKELEEKSTSEFFSVVQKEETREVTRKIKCYSLEAILAVGFRVRSPRGAQFRKWANTTLIIPIKTIISLWEIKEPRQNVRFVVTPCPWA